MTWPRPDSWSKIGVRWSGVRVDIRDLDALRQAAAQIQAAWGGIDIVHAHAGIQAFASLLEMEDLDWHDQIDINLTGTANTLRAFGPHLVGQGGRVIVTSSTQGQHDTLDGAAYSASKWGVLGPDEVRLGSGVVQVQDVQLQTALRRQQRGEPPDRACAGHQRHPGPPGGAGEDPLGLLPRLRQNRRRLQQHPAVA
jgi:hypothetical protein